MLHLIAPVNLIFVLVRAAPVAEAHAVCYCSVGIAPPAHED
jgi:hypothetical protein